MCWNSKEHLLEYQDKNKDQYEDKGWDQCENKDIDQEKTKVKLKKQTKKQRMSIRTYTMNEKP